MGHGRFVYIVIRMNKFFYSHKVWLLICVIGIGFVLRFFALGTNPPSLDWDEASLGYNAYSIFRTGADEYGNRLPLSFRSFDDYKPPLYVYLAVPSIAIFGLTDFAVRFPAAVIGVLTLIVVYFFVKELFLFEERYKREWIALLSTGLLALSPWHLQFSRAAFEGNVGLFFLILGIWLFLVGIRRQAFLLVASLAFVLCLYSYHSFRLLVPLLLFAMSILFFKQLKGRVKESIVALLILGIGILPIVFSFVPASGSGARLSMVTIFSAPETIDHAIQQLIYDKENQDSAGALFHNRRVVYFLTMAKGYLDHYNPDFLFFHGDSGRQHHAVDVGMLYLWDLPFLIIGLCALFAKQNKYTGILFVWLLLAPLPSAMTTGTPHPVRAIAMLPILQIGIAYGILVSFQKLTQVRWKILVPLVTGLASVLLLINVSYYVHQYYVHTPIEYGDFWQYGYKEAFAFAQTQETIYDKIIVTYMYDQPYIYYLYYNKIDPRWYQKYLQTNNPPIERMERVIGKYEFRKIDWARDKLLKNTLIIGAPSEIPTEVKRLRTIYFPDQKEAFIIVKT